MIERPKTAVCALNVVVVSTNVACACDPGTRECRIEVDRTSVICFPLIAESAVRSVAGPSGKSGAQSPTASDRMDFKLERGTCGYRCGPMLRQVLSAGNRHMPRQAGDEEGTTTKTSLRGGWIVGTLTQGGDC